MFFEWVVSTILVSASIYLLVMLFYYKSLLKKEQKSKNIIKNTLEEAEIVIRKYQIQLQRALGNIDILSDELSKVKNDIKGVRSRNSQYRLENEKLRQKIKELETKIEALL